VVSILTPFERKKMGEGVKFGEKANVDEDGERFVIVHC
jgi:hypothetical protein